MMASLIEFHRDGRKNDVNSLFTSFVMMQQSCQILCVNLDPLYAGPATYTDDWTLCLWYNVSCIHNTIS